MSPTFETVLSALCSRVEAMPAGDFQQIFLLGGAKEARLALEILVSHEFSARLYPETDADAARMYIVLPRHEDAMATEKKLTSALSHARALKAIKQSLDTLCGDPGAHVSNYSLSLTGLTEYEKTIAIRLESPEKPVFLPAASPVRKAEVRHQKEVRRQAPNPYEFLVAAPEITRQSWLVRRKQRARMSDRLRTRIRLYLQGHLAPASFIAVALLLVVILVFGILMVFKGYLCPDFVTDKKKNTAWYCQ